MKIFLSSTFRDLRDLRVEVESFLKSLGHKPLLSESEVFPINPRLHKHDICLSNVASSDLFVFVIDSAFGENYYKKESISVTWAEIRTAVTHQIPCIGFMRKDIGTEYQCYRHNFKKGNSFDPFFAKDLRIFKMITEIQRKTGIWMPSFENSLQIKNILSNYLKNLKNKNSNTEIPLAGSNNRELKIYKSSILSNYYILLPNH